MTIYFDMDGTIANLYGVESWLEFLQNEDAYPYRAAAPLVDVERFKKVLENLKAEGYRLGIISWLSRNGSQNYNKAVRQAKKEWLFSKITIKWDELHIVKYGTPKNSVCRDKNGILFDDEERNRKNWKGVAFDEKNIIEKLNSLMVS